jgi:tryptophan-rich sensory protein
MSEQTVLQRNAFSWQTVVQWLVIGALLVAILGVFFDRSIPVWYDSLRKPAFDPPQWLSAAIWVLLYACMAAAAWLVWRMPHSRLRTRALKLFSIELMLCLLWAMDFFYFHVVDPALFVIVLFWVALMLTTVRFWQLRRATIYLMAPSLAWVTFASALNLEIALLN